VLLRQKPSSAQVQESAEGSSESKACLLSDFDVLLTLAVEITPGHGDYECCWILLIKQHVKGPVKEGFQNTFTQHDPHTFNKGTILRNYITFE
jgi:hypothetical protein